jgi:hypothetical protein
MYRVNQWNGVGSPEIRLFSYIYLIFTKVPKANIGEKTASS